MGTLGGATAAQGTQGTHARLSGPATGPRGEGALMEAVRGGGGRPFTDDTAAADEGAVTRAHAARREASEGSRAMAVTGGASGAAGEAPADAVAEVVAEAVAEAVAETVAEPVAEAAADEEGALDVGKHGAAVVDAPVGVEGKKTPA